MLGVVCGALNVADATFRTCMTDFLHSLERCGVGLPEEGSAMPWAQRVHPLQGSSWQPMGLLQAWRPECCSPWAIFLPNFCYKSFARLEALHQLRNVYLLGLTAPASWLSLYLEKEKSFTWLGTQLSRESDSAEHSLLLFLHLNVKVIPPALEDARGSAPHPYLSVFCQCLACLRVHFYKALTWFI